MTQFKISHKWLQQHRRATTTKSVWHFAKDKKLLMYHSFEDVDLILKMVAPDVWKIQKGDPQGIITCLDWYRIPYQVLDDVPSDYEDMEVK